MMSSLELVDAVYERLDDVPSHAVVSMHRIIKETLAVLVELGFIAYADEGIEESDGVRSRPLLTICHLWTTDAL